MASGRQPVIVSCGAAILATLMDGRHTLAEIQGMQFRAAADAVGSASFSFTVTDDGTTAGAADPQTLAQSLTITVTEEIGRASCRERV